MTDKVTNELAMAVLAKDATVVSVYSKGELVSDSAVVVDTGLGGWFDVVFDRDGELCERSYHVSLGDYVVA